MGYDSSFLSGPRKRTDTYSQPDPTDQQSSMYQSSQAASPMGGMYQPPSYGGFSPMDFSGLSAGENVQIGDMNYTPGNQTGMYQAYKSAEASNFGNLTNLLGTQAQVGGSMYGADTQKSIAGINADADRYKAEQANVVGLGNLDFKKSLLPYLQQLMGTAGGGGSSYNSQLTSSVLNASNPANEQAAINAAEAYTKRAQADGLLNQYGQLGSANSPQAAAARQMAAASQAGTYLDAKRKIEDDYSQRRVGNLASAISAQNSSMNPLYSLFGQLMS